MSRTRPRQTREEMADPASGPQLKQAAAKSVDLSFLTWCTQLLRSAWPMWCLIMWLALVWLLLPLVSVIQVPSIALTMLIAALCGVLGISGAAVVVYRARYKLSDNGVTLRTMLLRLASLLLCSLFYILLPAVFNAISRETQPPLVKLLADALAPTVNRQFLVIAGYAILVVAVFYWGFLAVSSELSRLGELVEPVDTGSFIKSVKDSFTRIQGEEGSAAEIRVASMRRGKQNNYQVILRSMERIGDKDATGEMIAVLREKRYVVTANREGAILSFEEQAEKS